MALLPHSSLHVSSKLAWRVLTLGVLAAGITGGCASKGPTYVPPLARAEQFKPERDAYSRLGYRHEWTGFPTMTAGGRVNFFDVLGDVVVVQESTNTLSVLEAGNGASRWFDQVAGPLVKFVGNIRDDKTLLCTSESEVYFFDLETGNLVNKQKLDKVANTRPVVVQDRLVFGTASGEIFGQLKAGGFRVWGNQVAGSIQANPVQMGDLLGFVSDTGEVIILDGVSGRSSMRTQIYSGTIVDPAASDRLMFIASTDHSVYAFSPSRPAPVWRHRTDTPLRYQPTHHDGRLYCAIDGTGMVAFDAQGSNGDARIYWTNPDVLGTVIGVRNGRLVVWKGSTFTLLDPRDGATVDSVTLKNVGMVRVDKFVDGNMYIASTDGVVVKLLPRD
ncbi:MAG: PQQ-binding-like beta-propeller repeat protein [Phycisphaerales bacterium]